MDMPSAVLSRKRNTGSGQKRQNKPLIEKRRRARINDCLSQLQTLVLKAKKVESPRPGKLEKADILEMTVDYIKKNKNQDTDPDEHDAKHEVKKMQYLSGYERCIQEVVQFLDGQKDISGETKERISNYCSAKLRETQTTPVKQTELKAEKMEEDSQQESEQSDCDSEAEASGKETERPEVRKPSQTTAYVAPLLQQGTNGRANQLVQGGAFPSYVNSAAGVQIPVQQTAGQIKLICGGDIWILLDPSASVSSDGGGGIGGGSTKQTSPPTSKDAPSAKRGEGETLFSLGVPNTVPYNFSTPVLPFQAISPLSSSGQCFITGRLLSDTSRPFTRSNLVPSPSPSPCVPVSNNERANVDQCTASIWRPW